MTNFSCIIIDDDPFALEQLSECILNARHLSLTGSYQNPLQAINDINERDTPVDILFTDVEMPAISGIELVKKVFKKVKNVILVSSHIDYAIDGYEINAKRFLSKPFNQLKFDKLLKPLIDELLVQHDFLLISLTGKNHTLKLYHEDIIAIESSSNYMKVHTSTKLHVPYGTLNNMEQTLKDFPYFRRISRSVIINTNFILKIYKYQIQLAKDLTVTVGESYRKDFDEFVKHFICTDAKSD